MTRQRMPWPGFAFIFSIGPLMPWPMRGKACGWRRIWPGMTPSLACSRITIRRAKPFKLVATSDSGLTA